MVEHTPMQDIIELVHWSAFAAQVYKLEAEAQHEMHGYRPDLKSAIACGKRKGADVSHSSAPDPPRSVPIPAPSRFFVSADFWPKCSSVADTMAQWDATCKPRKVGESERYNSIILFFSNFHSTLL